MKESLTTLYLRTSKNVINHVPYPKFPLVNTTIHHGSPLVNTTIHHGSSLVNTTIHHGSPLVNTTIHHGSSLVNTTIHHGSPLVNTTIHHGSSLVNTTIHHGSSFPIILHVQNFPTYDTQNRQDHNIQLVYEHTANIDAIKGHFSSSVGFIKLTLAP